jgi:hypothetical protein
MTDLWNRVGLLLAHRRGREVVEGKWRWRWRWRWEVEVEVEVEVE